MSDQSSLRALPPLLIYPERAELSEHWTDRLEASLSSWPMAAWPRIRSVWIAGLVAAINRQEAILEAMDDQQLASRIADLRAELHRHQFRTELVVRTFALVRELSRRHLGLRHFDVQLRGGFAMLHGSVVEMDTGEGKTLTATLAAAVAALAGIPVHVVTVNDYLAQRDAQGMGQLYRALGLSVGTIVHGMQTLERRAAYACDITYASNKEIAFDYLRDRLALGNRPRNLAIKLQRFYGDLRPSEQVVMRGLHFAIVDEADSVLVDEARTPLIISRQSDARSEQAWAEEALRLAGELDGDSDYRIIRDERRVELTQQGRERLVELGETWGGIWRSRVRREEGARQALTALHLFHEGDHYLVREGKVHIVDEYTGRIMADRSWSEGLHQLVEVKEGCEVTSRKLPVARMTYQRFFRRYQRLAGMTGTAREVRREFWRVYRLPVVRIPTNRPLIRQRTGSRIYPGIDRKWQAIVERTIQLNGQGRPVLIGTRSVAASEAVSEHLSGAGLKHVVLNADQDGNEAEIITDAGKRGRITVATNMAGRGVDIRLESGMAELGGLHVILSERHDARRIDRQLEGRCGRQGEPGSTEAILSLEDPLLELIKSPLLHRLARTKGVVGQGSGLLLFRLAQRRAERSHARARHQLLKQDRRLGRLLAFSGGME